jgi:hypothetical protein
MDPRLEKWIEAASTLFGVIGITLVAFGILLIMAGFRLWTLWHK